MTTDGAQSSDPGRPAFSDACFDPELLLLPQKQENVAEWVKRYCSPEATANPVPFIVHPRLAPMVEAMLKGPKHLRRWCRRNPA